MIRYNPKSWFSLVFDVYSRYVMRQLLPMMVFIAAFTAAVEFVMKELIQLEYEGTLAFHSLLGILLGLFLVLRTNTAYDRWWEGRRLWGQLVNDCRNLSLKLNAMLTKEEDREFFRLMIPNIPFGMKEHLRDSIRIGEMDFGSQEQKDRVIQSKHRPNIINKMLYEKINELKNSGTLDSNDFFLIDKELKGFTDIIGACERIKSTPLPHSYSMFIKKFVFFYISSLPFALVWQFGYWTVPIITIMFYFLFSIELIAEEIEDPFGMDVNDLPLDDLSVKIRNNVQEIFS